MWETLGNPKRPRGRAPTAAREVDENFQKRAAKLVSHEQACERLTALLDDDGTRGSQAAAPSPGPRRKVPLAQRVYWRDIGGSVCGRLSVAM